MNIIGISVVKNEEDIIESNIRYHRHIFDKLLILDRGSTDHTPQIIKDCIDEGLNVEQLTMPFDEESTLIDVEYNKLLHIAYDYYDADLIVPVDADEFIATQSNDQNPREALTQTSKEESQLILWKTYTTHHQQYDKRFITERYPTHRAMEHEVFRKVIIPRQVVTDNPELEMTLGQHNLKDTPTTINDEIVLAHYPLRSKEQMFNKYVIGYLNMADKYKGGDGFHLQRGYKDIMNQGDATQEYLDYASGTFCMLNIPEEINLVYDELYTGFMDDKELKYGYTPPTPVQQLLTYINK